MTRVSVLVVVAVMIATLGGCASDASDVPRGWSRLSIKRAFGRHLDARPTAYIDGRFIAEGQRHSSRHDQEQGNYGAPLLWSSSDADTWEPLHFSGLPRHPACGSCGIGAIASTRGHHLLSWHTASGMRAYASKDLHTWHRVRDFPEQAFLDPATTPSGFLVSVRHGPMDGPWTLSGYTSPDGETWRRISSSHLPEMSGLANGVRFRGEYLTLDLSIPGASRVMHSPDDRVWSPVDGMTPQKLEGHLVVDARRGILGAEWFDVSTAKAVDARGAFVTSRDGSRWHEVKSFRRQFPHADLVAVGRVGAWWIVGGPVTEPKRGASRRWAFWTTRDLVHWRQNPSRLGHLPPGKRYLHTIHGVVFVTSAFGDDALLFRPPLTT